MLQANFCALCFESIVPKSSIRRLRHFFDVHTERADGQTEHVTVVSQLS
jgi:hypothetical protein